MVAASIEHPTHVDASPGLAAALARSAARHRRLCPRQVLGVRIGLAGVEAIAATARCAAGPRSALAVIVESDGCFLDGVEAATGCGPGRRNLRIEDYGKVAATFVDLTTGAAVRVAPAPGIRERAFLFAPGETARYYAQLAAYQRMPVSELLTTRTVALRDSLAALRGQAGGRVCCRECGEEILNGRGISRGGIMRCRSCAAGGYYRQLP